MSDLAILAHFVAEPNFGILANFAQEHFLAALAQLVLACVS